MSTAARAAADVAAPGGRRPSHDAGPRHAGGPGLLGDAPALARAGAREALGAREERGALELRFRPGPRGRTELAQRRQRFPLRMTVPFHLDPAIPEMAWVYVQNPTGGVFAGDRLELAVHAEPESRVHLTTQSATKLYRMEAGGEAHQRVRLDVGAGAYVENMPDALIPQAATRYRQRTEVDLAEGAACISGETLAPGRRAHGERFAYGLVELSTAVRRAGRELCVETLRFEPPRGRPDRAGVLAGGDYLVTLFALAPERDADALAAALDAALVGLGRVGVRGAAGTLPSGAGARAIALAPDAPAAERALRAAWGAARRALLDLPLPGARK
ncbi:MAG TPA: urease accessory protein UreD [Conexibacter sp.]|nr:urease accessory protein UreD [Conexibacter sp.]